VTTMGQMFIKSPVFDQDLRGWDVARVTDHEAFDSQVTSGWTRKPTFRS
jgi:hypothetical protein